MNVQELIITESNSEFLSLSANKLTKDKESARDLVQDTLFLALKNSQRFTEHTNIRGWLFTIMRNCFINKYRHDQRRRNIDQKAEAPFLLNSILHSDENKGKDAATIKFIHRCIQELPRVFSSPISLLVEGYKYKEIAWLLNESEGTIKSRIHFARKMLRERLGSIVNRN